MPRSYGRCSQPECPEVYPLHKWGTLAASDAGWFFQRDGRAWCPVHVPAWVAGWRRRNDDPVSPPCDADTADNRG